MVCCAEVEGPKETQCFPLGKAVSSFGAEVEAIRRALVWAKSKLEGHITPHRITILSDCQQAVRLARRGDLGLDRSYWSHESDIKTLKEGIREGDHQVSIDWIPGHTECQHNNLADSLAKRAASTSLSQHGLGDTDTKFRRPFLLAKSFVRRRLDAWKTKIWLTSRRGRQLFELNPNPNQAQPKEQRSLTRWAQVAISRLRIGNATTNQSLFLVGKSVSRDCDHCEGQTDSPEHRLLGCPSYSPARAKLATACGLSHSRDLCMTGLLAPQGPAAHKSRVAKALMRFLDETNLRELFIWRPTSPNLD